MPGNTLRQSDRAGSTQDGGDGDCRRADPPSLAFLAVAEWGMSRVLAILCLNSVYQEGGFLGKG